MSSQNFPELASLVMRHPKPRQFTSCPFQRAVSSGIEIASLDCDYLIRLDPMSFETMACRRFIIKLADIE